MCNVSAQRKALTTALLKRGLEQPKLLIRIEVPVSKERPVPVVQFELPLPSSRSDIDS